MERACPMERKQWSVRALTRRSLQRGTPEREDAPGALLVQMPAGTAPSPLLVAYLRHAVQTDMISAATLVEELARREFCDRVDGATDEPAATLLSIIAEALPGVHTAAVSWDQFLADSTAGPVTAVWDGLDVPPPC